MGKCYEITFKLKVVRFAEEKGNHAAHREFKVDRKRIREWRQIKDKLQETDKSRKRRKGAGRKVHYQDIEVELLRWFKERRDKGVRVTGKGLQNEALRLHRCHGNQSFKASSMWFYRFKKRHGISFRRPTHIAQKARAITEDRVDTF